MDWGARDSGSQESTPLVDGQGTRRLGKNWFCKQVKGLQD